MSLIQLTYCSRPFGFDEVILSGILIDARVNNLRNDISGALICRADLYLQLLEGPEAAVEAAFGRIRRDNRHLEVRKLYSRPVSARIFANWSMRDDPVRSWMWSVAEVEAGALGRASAQDIQAVFTRLSVEPSD